MILQQPLPDTMMPYIPYAPATTGIFCYFVIFIAAGAVAGLLFILLHCSCIGYYVILSPLHSRKRRHDETNLAQLQDIRFLLSGTDTTSPRIPIISIRSTSTSTQVQAQDPSWSHVSPLSMRHNAAHLDLPARLHGDLEVIDHVVILEH